jgi:uncharacterized protein
MVLEGVVTNVAAFGAFVDIGVHQDGLVHVSAMSRDYVSDPRQVTKSGDVVRVRVLSVDTARKRISLTLRLDDEAGEGPARARRGGGQPGGGAKAPSAEGAPKPGAGRPAGDGAASDRGTGQRGGGRPGRTAGDRPGRGSGQNSGRGSERGSGQPGGAMADALRRAGLTGDTPKKPT